MKNRQTWLIIGLTGIIIYLILSRPSKPESAVIIQATDSIQQITEANRILAMNARTLETRLVETQVKSKSDSARFYREITAKNQQLARKRVVVQHIIDTIPALKEFVETADAVIQLQRERIDSMEVEKKFLQGVYNDLVYMKAKQLTNLEIVVSQQNIIIESQEKTIRKKQRGNRFLKVGIIALPVAALLFGAQL